MLWGYLIGRHIYCSDFRFRRLDVAGFYMAGAHHVTILNWIFELAAFGGGEPVRVTLFQLRTVEGIEY